MESSQNKLYFTRMVLPIEGAPIEDAAIWVDNGRLRFVGTKDDLDIPRKYYDELAVQDLGDTLLMPGFVNAHAHLELGSARGLRYRQAFTDWIRDLLEMKAQWTKEFQYTGIREAAESLAKSGVTTIADHMSADGPLEAILQTPFRGRIFIEALGVAFDVAEKSIHTGRATQQSESHRQHAFHTHLSPHSAHALHPEALKSIIENGDRFSIHLHESRDEILCFAEKTGAMADLLKSRATITKWPEWQAKTPIAHLFAQGLLSKPLLVVHGNIVSDQDLASLDPKRHAFVHCPHSHRYFEHPRFPLERVQSRGFHVAIGTDSWASNPHQNFLEELRLFRNVYPEKSDADVLKAATLEGAIALGMDDQIGSLATGKLADLIGFPFRGGNPYQAIFEARNCSFRVISPSS